MSQYSIDPETLTGIGARIEQRIDVSRLRYCGEPVWNAIRVLLLGTHNWSFGPRGTVQAAKRRRTIPIVEQLRSLQKFVRRERPLRPVELGWLSLYVDELSPPRADVLLFDAADLLRLDTDGQVFSRIFSHFYDVFESNHVVSALGHHATLERAFYRRPTVLYGKPSDGHIYPAQVDAKIEGLDELMSVLQDLPCPFSADQLTAWVRSIHVRSEAFLQLVDALSPKVVLLTSFKSSDRMALLRACRVRGIPTVEVQHGLLGPEYQQLSCVERGRDWIPDYFWLWGEQSAREMRPVPPRVGPELLVGGNFELLAGVGKVRPLSEREPGPPRVLFIEQYTHSHTADLLTLVYRDLKARGVEAVLSMRLHPRSLHLKKAIADELQARSVPVEIDIATNSPLYAVLERADVVVVESSTVAHEASAVGRRVVVYGSIGAALFPHDIRSGAFRFAPELTNVGGAIVDSLAGEHIQSDFFNTDHDVMRAAVNRLRGLARGGSS